MILFKCSSREFEPSFHDIYPVSISYLSETTGYFNITDTTSLESLSLYLLNLEHESSIKLTCLQAYDLNHFTKQALEFITQHSPNKVHHLSDVVMIALFKQDEIMIDVMHKWLTSLDRIQLETASEFVNSNGSVSQSAAKLYVHRNTMMNRLNAFYTTTGFDLRVVDNRMVLKYLLTYFSMI